MLSFRILTVLVIAGLCTCCATRKIQQPSIPPYIPEDQKLHDAITQVDSLFFDAYNHCKLEVFEELVSEDLEFYHDRGGLTTSKKQIIESLKTNICNKVTRELLKGSIEVYPVPGYGAVQMGAHRFYNNQEKTGPSRFSKFVHTWKWENNRWQLTRVISLH